jgi:hypothetical protein
VALRLGVRIFLLKATDSRIPRIAACRAEICYFMVFGVKSEKYFEQNGVENALFINLFFVVSNADSSRRNTTAAL